MPLKIIIRRGRALLLCVSTLLAGCDTRSISNAGYPGSSNPLYRGELTDIDVLGVADTGPITENRIAEALATSRRTAPTRGEALMVVQSGAPAPDQELVSTLAPNFNLGTFSGVPPVDRKDFSKQLRLIAAEGGYSQILCYWGTLETAKSNEVTKTISWVPIIGWALPDQSQKMRVSLRAALVDVGSGHWRLYRPEPIEDERLSAILNRQSNDHDQVVLLKTAGYAALAHDLLASAN